MTDTDLLDAPDDTMPLDDLSVDPESMLLSVVADDEGGVTIEIGKPEDAEADDVPSDHDQNLAEVLDEMVLGKIGSTLIEQIDADEQSRSGWLETRAQGIEMLGLTIRRPDGAGGPLVSGISTVTHPLLLEAVLRFQANARSELLPTDGPVKIRNDARTPPAGLGHNGGPSLTDIDDSDELANALESDFNHYLTTTATEFIPSTDQMLFWVGLGGMEFKKVYHDSVRRRPVSEWVDAKDLIVSNNATDIASAGRVTQRIRMRPAMIKRMQLAETYRDIDLGSVSLGLTDGPVEQAIQAQQGLVASSVGLEDEDRERTLFECYCELDIEGFEHEVKGKPSGLPLPYKVVLDEETYQVLEIRRNWKPDDEQFQAKQVFVPYTFVPGLGFYGIGLLHILGNTTNAATAAQRMALDAAMLANFPGGLISEDATRQDSINLTAGVGEFRKVKSTGGNIRDAVMPFPYKGADASLIQMLEMIAADGARIGGTADIQVGEGKQDAPVGTTIALLEQAKVPLDAVHKRLHAAQAREFDLLTDLFREDPEAFWRSNKRPAQPWDEAMLIKALDDYDLVPMADPNTSSQLQRQMRYALLLQVAEKAPQFFRMGPTIMAALKSAKIPNIESLIDLQGSQPGPNTGKNAPQGQPAVDPSRMVSAQAQVIAAQAKAKQVDQQAQDTIQSKQADLAVAQLKSQDNLRSLQDQAADRASKEHLVVLDMRKEALVHQHQQQMETHRQVLEQNHVAATQHRDHLHEGGLAALQHGISIGNAARQANMDAASEHRDRVHQMNSAMLEHYHELRAQQMSHEHALEQIKAKPQPKPASSK